MVDVPNLKIARWGFEYLKASQILEKNGLLWPAAINSALAIEICLKCFLPEKNTWKDHPSGGHLKTSENSEHEHLLSKLFEDIPDDHKKKLLTQASHINPDKDLKKSLKKYNNVFKQARYPYEKDSTKIVDDDIIRLAEIMKEAIINLTSEK